VRSGNSWQTGTKNAFDDPTSKPFLLVDSFLTEEGQVPFCQKVIFDQARTLDEAIIRECIVEEETRDARDADE